MLKRVNVISQLKNRTSGPQMGNFKEVNFSN